MLLDSQSRDLSTKRDWMRFSLSFLNETMNRIHLRFLGIFACIIVVSELYCKVYRIEGRIPRKVWYSLCGLESFSVRAERRSYLLLADSPDATFSVSLN